MTWQDLIVLVRALRHVLMNLNHYHVLRMPVDKILHVVVAAMIFLVLTRWMRKTWAFLIAAGAIILKEAVDVAVKLRRPGFDASDSVWDVAAGVAGVAAAFLIVRFAGEKWRSCGLHELAPAGPPPSFEMELGAKTTRLLAGAALAAVVVAVVGIEWASWVNWLHVLGVVLVWTAAWRFGIPATLAVLLPLVPFVNWFNYDVLHSGSHPLAASDPLLLSLAAFGLVRVLRSRHPVLRLHPGDLLFYAFAVLATFAVTLSSVQLGPTPQRFAWAVAVFDCAAVFFLVTQTFSRRHLLWTAGALLAGLFVMCAAGIVEFSVRPFVPQVTPGSVYDGAEMFSIYLAMAAPFALGLALLGRGGLRWLGAAAALLALICVGLVYSRACWVSATVSLSFLGVIWAARKDTVLAAAAVLAVVFSAFVGYHAMALAGEMAGGKSPFLKEVTSIIRPGTLEQAREAAIRTATQRIRTRPWLGTPAKWVDSYYLTVAATYGLPAAFLLMILVGWLMIQGLLFGWGVRDVNLFALVGAAMAGVVGALVEGVAESGYARPGYIPLFWFLLAAIPMAIRLNAARRPSPGSDLSRSEAAGQSGGSRRRGR